MSVRQFLGECFFFFFNESPWGPHTRWPLIWHICRLAACLRRACLWNEGNRLLTALHRRAGMLLTSSTLPFTYSRSFICLLPGVTPVAVHDVGACAALPCLLQDRALHGKKTHASCCQFWSNIRDFELDTHLMKYCEFRRSSTVRLLHFVTQRPSSSCLRFTVAWLLNEDYTLIYSSRCL